VKNPSGIDGNEIEATLFKVIILELDFKINPESCDNKIPLTLLV
jgi:hypothetical protein